MKSFFDSTLITSENHDFPLKAELETLVANIQSMEQEYNSASAPYKPFISANGLYALQKSLENKDIAETNTPQTLLEYLQKIIHLHQHIKQFLSEIHQQLIEKLIESKFQLLHTVVTKLQNSTMSLEESQACLSNANQIFDKLDLLSEHKTPSTADAIKEAMTSLSETLKQQELQQKINDQILVFSQMDFDSYANLDTFIPAITPLREALNALSQQADQEGYNDLVDQASSILSKSYVIEAQLIKRRLDSHLQTIEQDQWATIEIKRDMYQKLIPIYNATLRVFSQLTCSAVEKRSYINYLRAGFELCVDEDFLALMNQSAHLFYTDDTEQQIPILNYTEQSHNKFDLVRSAIQKKRGRCEAPTAPDADSVTPDELSEKRTKQRSSGSDEETSEANDKSLQYSFINIIAPLINASERPSRRFMATMLKSLGSCVWGIKGIENFMKLTMHYDLLVEAQALCPADEPALVENIKNQLELLRKGNERLVWGYKKYGTQEIQLDPNTHFSQNYFKQILHDFVVQLAVSVPKGSLNTLLKKLLDNWMRTLTNEKCISPVYIDQMREAIEGSSFSEREFRNITDALRNASPIKFDHYLDALKLETRDNKDYLDHLTNRNKYGNTPLHTALLSPMPAVNNLQAYLVEVKAMYGDSERMSFHRFLISQNRDGLTFLHYLALLGDIGGLRTYTELLKSELGEADYARALRIKTPGGNKPYCNPTNSNSGEINTFLQQERTNHPVTESSSSRYGGLFARSGQAATSSAHSFYGARPQ